MPESSDIRIRAAAEVAADACVRDHCARIGQVLPGADLVHVGSTAVPGALTKGDVDPTRSSGALTEATTTPTPTPRASSSSER